jgi:hypothetical protein
MRLSLRKAAHAAMFSAAWQEIRVSRPVPSFPEPAFTSHVPCKWSTQNDQPQDRQQSLSVVVFGIPVVF